MKRSLDTNAYVAMRRGEPQVIDLVRDADALTVSLVVVGELLYGFYNGQRARQNTVELEAFLAQPSVDLRLPSWETAERFGQLSAELRRAATPIPTNDIWIAAQAMEAGAELVTFDRHFERISGLPARILRP